MADNPYNALTHEQVDLMLDHAWLNLAPDDFQEVENLLRRDTLEHPEDPQMHMLRIMRQPKNFYLTARLLFGMDIMPYQGLILEELWNRPFPMLIASRGGSKSSTIGLYILLRAFFLQERKIVVTGGGFRQAKQIMTYAENLWNRSPIMQSMCKGYIHQGMRKDVDKWTMRIGDSSIVALPMGDRVRGERANDTVADEFATVPRDDFERIVGGFGIVSGNPVEKVKQEAKLDLMRKLGIDTKEIENVQVGIPNQKLISGSAYYQFNHFYEYFRNYRSIIESKGDPAKLMEIMPNGIPEGFDWRDYSIIRLPYNFLPKGFLDQKQLAQARASYHSSMFLLEYGACFSSDSNGFFRRSTIEQCVTRKAVQTPNGSAAHFHANIVGTPGFDYIYGIDPASERDKFSIVILEIHEDHRRVVYCWTTDKANHREKVKAGYVKERDFYSYVARKIRDLMRVFPTHRIGMDSQGGGRAVAEALHDVEKLEEGEQPIWEIIEKDNKKEDDDQAGLHILELVNFVQAEWTSGANHGLKKDFEDHAILFPYVDPISGMLAGAEDEENDQERFDNLEACIDDIEELKDEIATIVVTQTPSGREHWDTPDKQEPGRKGRQRKDRYSALLIANMVARCLQRGKKPRVYKPVGGAVTPDKSSRNKQSKGPRSQLFEGPNWFTEQANKFGQQYGAVIRRRR